MHRFNSIFVHKKTDRRVLRLVGYLPGYYKLETQVICHHIDGQNTYISNLLSIWNGSKSKSKGYMTHTNHSVNSEDNEMSLEEQLRYAHKGH